MSLSDRLLSDRLPLDRLPLDQLAARTCRRCGGGGTLRMADQCYRTCLDCLGQGRIDPVQVEPVAVADRVPVGAAIAVNLSAVSSAR